MISLLILILAGLAMGLLISGLPTVITVSILGGIIASYLVFFHPGLIIAVLLCVAPFNILWIGVGATAPEIIYSAVYILLLFSWIFKKVLNVIFSGRTEKITSPITVPLIVFFCVACLACIIGMLRGHQFFHWASDLNTMMYYSLCFIMLDAVKNKRQLYRIFVLLIISAALGLLWGLYYLLTTGAGADTGINIIYRGLSKLRNASAFSLIMFIISVAMATILPKGRRRALFVFLSLFFGVMLVTSYTRSAWIAAVFGLAFLFFVSLAKQKANFLKLILVAVIALSLYFSIAMSVPTDNPLFKSIYAIEKRYESIFTAKEEPSIITRGSEWQEAKRKALEHPFFGNGLGTEITYFRYDNWFRTQTWDTTRYVHNAYLYLFLNMGALGLISFLWFCIFLVRYGLRLYGSLAEGIDKALVLGIVSSFASLMVVSLAGPFLASPTLTMWLGFFIGALIIIDRSRKNIEPRT
jgi:O-antigen ligase